MKRIEKFVARDRSEHNTEDGALHREYLLDELARIESLLPKHPNTTEFSNGGGYIQHTARNVARARQMLYELACEEMSVLSNYSINAYAFSRYLTDNSKLSIMYNLYSRLIFCMDENTWREYGQGYYSTHPDEADQICINED